jgi:hypothetical protein
MEGPGRAEWPQNGATQLSKKIRADSNLTNKETAISAK